MKSSITDSPNLADLRGLDSALRGVLGAPQEARRAAIRVAAAKVLVLRGYGPHRLAREANRLLPVGSKVETDHALWRITRGWKRLLPLIERGGLFPQGLGGGWTEGLVMGLRMSGAIRRDKLAAAGWRVTRGVYPAVEAIFLAGGLPFACRAALRGEYLWLGGFWAGRLGAEEPSGVDVVAGLLLGHRRVEWGGRFWMGVKSSVATRVLLDSWGVPVVCRGLRLATGVFDLVSPFWGALFAWRVPEVARVWMEGWKRPGSCPLLPWAFLRMAGGRGVSYKLPRGSLPYLVSREAMYDRGILVGDIHERAVRELGLARIDPRMRDVWVGYMGAKGFQWEGL